MNICYHPIQLAVIVGYRLLLSNEYSMGF